MVVMSVCVVDHFHTLFCLERVCVFVCVMRECNVGLYVGEKDQEDMVNR